MPKAVRDLQRQALGPAVLAVTGLKREAVLISGPGVRTVVSGGDIQALTLRLEAVALADIAGVISVGLGGALSPAVALGDWVVATSIQAQGERFDTDAAWAAALEQRLHGQYTPALLLPTTSRRGEANPASSCVELVPHLRGGGGRKGCQLTQTGAVHLGALAGADQMVADAAAKAALHRPTGALAVDMESHLAAGFARRHGLPFAALRVISDGHNRSLPRAAQAGLKADGRMNIAAVLKSLAADPRQLPALIRTGREAEIAFRQLRLLGGHDLLCGPGIGCPYLSELFLDMA